MNKDDLSIHGCHSWLLTKLLSKLLCDKLLELLELLFATKNQFCC